MARSAFWLVPALCVVAAVGTMEQDLAFGFRQLTDIAERALSPAVNDPTTAVQAIDVPHDLLRALATRSGPPGCWRDEDGQARLVVPQYGFADFLELAVGEIWHYGAGAAQVPARMTRMLADLQSAALAGYRPAIAAWYHRVTAADPPHGHTAALRAELAALDIAVHQVPGDGAKFPVGVV